MSYGLNKVTLIGNLGKDPELKYTPSGEAVVRFSIATNESYKDPNGQLVERTEWHNIVAWRKLAELFGQYLKKGSKVYLEGKLQTRSWEDKEGNKRYTTEIVANEFVFLDTRGGGGESAASHAEPVTAPAPEKEDDLPF